MKRHIEWSLLVILLLSVFVMAAPVFAQNAPNITYASEDGAVQFSYSGDWTIETRSTKFNQSYSYELWTHSNAIAIYFGTADRSRMTFDIVNPREAGYPASVISPLDYAKYNLPDQDYELSEMEVAGYPAVRVVPAHPVMPTPQPIVVQENFGPPATLTPKPTVPYEGRFYAIVRDDGWVILINMTVPKKEIEQREEDLLLMVKSLEFDAHAASTSFERNLEVYDVSGVELTQTYSSDDGNFTVRYPANWKIDEDRHFNRTMGDPIVSYAIPFTPPDTDVKVSIIVMDATSAGLGFPSDQNTPEEYMQAERQSTQGERKQFQIGEFDAVIMFQLDQGEAENVIEFALNDSWVAFGSIKSSNREQTVKYERETVAILTSLRLALGSSFISSPVLNVSFPTQWVLGVTEQDNGEYYRFILRPAGAVDPNGPRVIIELYSLEANNLSYVKNIEDLKILLGYLITPEKTPKTISIGRYKVVRAFGVDEEIGAFVDQSLFLGNDNWLVAIRGGAFSAELAHDTLPCINTIIRDMTLTLP